MRRRILVAALASVAVLAAAVPVPAKEPAATGDVDRIAGDDRIRTAIEVSEATFSSARTAVVATASNYPDALAGSVLAASVGGPVLLTPTDTIHRAVLDELNRLGVEETLVLGGPRAVSDRVMASFPNPRRIEGRDRFETAGLIGNEIDPEPQRVILVTGTNFPDAVSVSAFAAANGWPIVLTTRDALPAATRNYLNIAQPETIVPIGGPAAISEAVLRDLDRDFDVENRIAGSDRFETSFDIAAQHLSAVPTISEIWLATGLDFPDALAAGPAAVHQNAAVLLSPATTTDLDGVATDPRGFVEVFRACDESGPLDTGSLIGGTGALSADVEQELRALLSCR